MDKQRIEEQALLGFPIELNAIASHHEIFVRAKANTQKCRNLVI